MSSIRQVVPIVLSIQITVAVGLTGWISFQSSERAVQKLTRQLCENLNFRVEQQITSYLEESVRVNQAMTIALTNGSVNPNDISQVQKDIFNKLRDKRLPIPSDAQLEAILKTFSRDGKLLFENYVKNNPRIYSPSLSTYRVYSLKDIVNVYEMRFEDDILQKMFGEGSNTTTQRNVIQDEINDRNG